MIQSSTPIQIPDRVEDKLRDVRRTRDVTQFARAVLLGLCALFVAMSIAMFVDWSLTLFDTFWRTVLTFTSLATAAATVIVSVVLTLSRRRALAQVAGEVDRSVPLTEERWSTVAELAAAPLEEQQRIHTGMLNRLSSEATQLDPQVVPANVVSKRGLYWCGVGLGSLVLLLLLACLIDWQQTSILVQRFWAPTARISVTQLSVTDSHGVAARGEPLVVQATMQGRLMDEATLMLRHDDLDETQHITVDASGEQANLLTHQVKAAEHNLQFRFRAGDGETDWQSVTVVDRPEITGIRFRAIPPAWTNTDPVEFNELPEKAAIIEGSLLEVDVLPRTTVEQVAFHLNNGTPHPLSSSDGRWYQYRTTLDEDLTFRAVLTESHGLENKHPPVCRIRVYHDQAPTVSIVSPDEEMAARPDDVIDIKYNASDDFGITKAELVIYDEDDTGGAPRERQVIDIPLNHQQNATEVSGSVALDLAQLNLEHGSALSYSVRVYDNHQSSATAGPSGAPTDQPAASAAEEHTLAQAEDESSPEDADTPQPATAASQIPGSGTASDSESQNSETRSSQQAAPQSPQVAAGSNSPPSQNVEQPSPGSSQSTTPPTATATPSSASRSDTSQSTASSQPNSSQPNSSQRSTTEPSATSPEESTLASTPSDSAASNGNPTTSPSTSSPASSSPSSASASPSENQSEMTGAAPPAIRRTPSALDSAQSASSGMMKLNIDKWSGSFASQQRRRVEMMISPGLRSLEEHLREAEDQLREALNSIEADDSPAGSQDRLLRSADQHLNSALDLIMTVRDQSADTLYTFIGLQLSEIADTHLLPAKDSLRSGMRATQNAEKASPVRSAWQQVSRARQRLAELTGQFERIRREHALADAVEQVRNMYLVFVEGSFELMSRDQDEINDYQRRIAQFEVDEEYLERLREVLEMRQKLVAEFARLLSEDPRLLRRFIDSINNQSETLRDQLTLLTLRQQAVGAQLQSWMKLDPDLKTAALAGLIRNKLRESIEITQAAAQLQEDFETWSPLTPDNSKNDLDAARAELAQVAAAARDVEDKAAAWRLPAAANDNSSDQPAAVDSDLPSLQDVTRRGHTLGTRLQELDARLMDLSVRESDVAAGPFFVRRLADVRRLSARVSAWVYQLEELEQGHFHVSASVDQHDIALKTNELTANLANLEQRIAGVLQRDDGTLPADIADLSRRLLATLDDQVAPGQLGAVFAMRQNDLNTAVRRAETATAAMMEAEQLFDELIKRTIEEADQLPVQDPIAALLDDPTLDELLALLENEAEQDLAAVLGIPPRPTNLQTVGGFMINQPADGGLLTMSALSGPLQSLQSAGRRAVNRAQEELNDITLRNNLVIDDWNVIGSQLEERLLQGQDRLPPEQYRRAIEQYFEELSRRSASSEETSP